MKNRELFDKSKSVEDRLKQIELVVTRVARRSNTKKAAMITPYPISNATFGEDIRGPILRYMFPCDGVIQKGMLKLGKKPKEPISIGLNISSEEYSHSRGYVVEKRQMVVKPDMNIRSGDCLTIHLLPNEEEKVTEVWVSFLWIPSVSDVTTKGFLVEELERDMLEE
jgi:hypothetical protein